METEESTNRMGDTQEEIELLEERTERLMQVKYRVRNEKRRQIWNWHNVAQYDL